MAHIDDVVARLYAEGASPAERKALFAVLADFVTGMAATLIDPEFSVDRRLAERLSKAGVSSADRREIYAQLDSGQLTVARVLDAVAGLLLKKAQEAEATAKQAVEKAKEAADEAEAATNAREAGFMPAQQLRAAS